MRLMTESAVSRLRPGAAERLHLPIEAVPKKLMTLSDTDVRSLAKIGDFRMGGLSLSDVYLQITPPGVDKSDASLDDYAGIIGMDLLSAQDLDLDFPHRQMTLYSPSSCNGGAARWPNAYATLPLRRTPFGNFYFIAHLNGKRLETAISTGTGLTQLTRETAKRVYGIKNEGNTVSQVMQLSAPPLKADDETVYFIDVAPGECRLTLKEEAIGYVNCFGVFPLELGMSTLESLHVYLATRQNLMYYARGEPIPVSAALR